MLTFWEIMTNERFETDSRVALKNLDFFFGDVITEDEDALYDGDYKWLRQIGDRKFFLPNMERMYPSPVLSPTHVRPPRDGVGSFQAYFRCDPW